MKMWNFQPALVKIHDSVPKGHRATDFFFRVI